MTLYSNLDHKARGVIGAFAADQGIDRRAFAGLGPFLQGRLGVAHVLADVREGVGPVAADEAARGVHAAVLVERGDDGFAGAGEDGALAAAAAAGFRIGEDQMLAEAGALRGAGAGFLADQCVELERERAFDIVRIARVQFLGDDQAEHAVADEFETLIGHLRVGAGMGQRALQQIAIRKDVPQPLFEISR